MEYEIYLEQNKNFVAWGYCDFLFGVIGRLDSRIKISKICDSNFNKWGKTLSIGDKYLFCISPNELKKMENVVVLVGVQSRVTYEKIKDIVEKMGHICHHINEILAFCMPQWEKTQIAKYDATIGLRKEPEDRDSIKCFISVSVPIDFCNLQCSYCYVGQQKIFCKKETSYPSAEFIRRALSRKRIGGTAFINFCGTGETLLCNEIIDIIRELLREGHYISIITNALITAKINMLLDMGYNDHLFFKCSFHYIELKKKKLLDRFAENVCNMRRQGASISVELVPHDELIPYIDEIKSFSLEKFGALPHVTVARDESRADMKILSWLSEKEYKNIWGQFDSDMFRLKMKTREKQDKYCIAGRGSFVLNLDYGGMNYCPKNEYIGNAYIKIDQPLELKDMQYSCKSPYCINAHAYITLGMVPDISENTYLDMRDRICVDGTHWVGTKMANIMQQRVCDNIGKE